MSKKKEKLAAIIAILAVFVLLCMSCAVPVPLMLPIADSCPGSVVIDVPIFI